VAVRTAKPASTAAKPTTPAARPKSRPTPAQAAPTRKPAPKGKLPAKAPAKTPVKAKLLQSRRSKLCPRPRLPSPRLPGRSRSLLRGQSRPRPLSPQSRKPLASRKGSVKAVPQLLYPETTADRVVFPSRRDSRAVCRELSSIGVQCQLVVRAGQRGRESTGCDRSVPTPSPPPPSKNALYPSASLPRLRG